MVSLVFSIDLKADPITWQSQQVRTWQSTGGFSIVFAHQPDGRFVLGQQSKLFVQDAWGSAAMTEIAANGRTFDPSFVVVRSASSALIGAGGTFGAISGLHPFNPSSPVTGVAAALPTTLQNYAAAYWKSPTSALEGWLVAGANGPSGPFAGHNVIFVSIDGTTSGAVTQELCSYGAGIAVDTGGNLYTALFELDGSPGEADADKVLRFSAAQVEAAIQSILSASPAPLSRNAGTFIHKFDSASSIAVDGQGRVWACGFKVEHVQVYNPSTGGVRTLVPEHAAITNAGQRGYQLSAFSRSGTDYIGFLAYDLWGSTGTPVIIGQAPVSEVTVPATGTISTWRASKFSGETLTLANEDTLWGDKADPDHDGLTNLAEYALNTQPLSHDGTGAITHTKSGGLLSFSFVRNPLNTDLTYTVEASGTLATNGWTAIASSSGGAVTVAGTASSVTETAEGVMQRVTVVDEASAAGAPRRFMRLRVTLTVP